MPRRYRRRRRRRRTAKAVAYKALKLAKKNASKMEVKYQDTELTNIAVDADGIGPVELCLTSRGTSDFGERIGDQIKMSSLNFRYTMARNGSNAAFMRIIIIRDTQDGIGDTIDLLRSVGDNNVINSPYIKDTGVTYKILYDKVHKIAIDSSEAAFRHKYIKLGAKVQYDAEGNFVKNPLKMFAFSPALSSATVKPTMRAWFRLNYFDG